MGRWLALCAFGLGGGCFGGGSPADLKPIEVALGAAASLGQAASLGLGMAGMPAGCVAVSAGCGATFPCNGAATVALGNDCPLPLGDGATGSVTEVASFSSADASTMTTTFVNAAAGGQPVAVVDAKNLTVQRSMNNVTVTYVGQDVDVHSGGTLAAQSSWTVKIDTAGTTSPGDDRYTIDGVQQGAGGVGTQQLTVTSAVLDPACHLNPISGSGLIQVVSITSIQQTQIQFHAACDGTADVTPTAGGARKVALDFFQ